jgi:hypothetical protein
MVAVQGGGGMPIASFLCVAKYVRSRSTRGKPEMSWSPDHPPYLLDSIRQLLRRAVRLTRSPLQLTRMLVRRWHHSQTPDPVMK